MKNRAKFVEVPLRPIERLRIYFNGLREAIATMPPQTYTKTVIVKPGDEGYDDCWLAVEYTSGFGGFVNVNNDKEETDDDER